VFNSAGLTAYYARTQGSAVAITLATQTVTGAFSSGGFVEVDATNMPGIYRFDPPDAAFATGVDKAVILLKGATNMAVVTLEYQLTGFDPEALTWLTPTVAGRTLDVTATGAAGIDLANVENQSTTLNLSATTTNLVNTVTTYTGNTVQTGDSFSRIGATGSGLTTLSTAANLATVAGYLDTEIAAILALLDDARGEPGQGTPPVNPDLATKIDYLYKAFRNRHTQTATEFAIYADDAVTKDHEAVVSDDGVTFDRGELSTGA
jgi:hypothetical protein